LIFALRTRRHWIIAGIAAICFITGVALSYRIEPGVRVEKVTLAEETPALKFALAIFLGCVPFQCLELPRTTSETLAPHTPIKLDAKLFDACVGEYEFPPDNAYWVKWKMTIRRQGDRLVEQITTKNKSYPAVEICPESETNFFVTAKDPHELTFVKNDKGEVTAVIVRFPGIPVREGKKLKSE